MSEQKRQRTVTGKVVSNKMTNTITVKVERRVIHPKYKKVVTKSSKVHAHAPDNDCQVGDVVTVAEIRPVSKTKTWQLKHIDKRIESDK